MNFYSHSSKVSASFKSLWNRRHFLFLWKIVPLDIAWYWPISCIHLYHFLVAFSVTTVTQKSCYFAENQYCYRWIIETTLSFLMFDTDGTDISSKMVIFDLFAFSSKWHWYNLAYSCCLCGYKELLTNINRIDAYVKVFVSCFYWSYYWHYCW